MTCFTQDDLDTAISNTDTEIQIAAFRKIQTFVLVTIFILLLQLGHLLRPFAYGIFRILSWLSYLLVPVLISYILGLMGRPTSGYGTADTETVTTFRYLSCVWAIFLLFAYAGFDNLNAFSLEERNGRSKLVFQIIIQFALLFLIINHLPTTSNMFPVVCAIIILAFKFLGRVLALAHSAGATPRIKTDVARLINYMNRKDADDDKVVADVVSMAGFDFLVGPKYAKIEDRSIVDGMTMEMITLGTQGILLGSSSETNIELKDTCLSFSLFWLLLGKFWSYPLYNSSSSSRAKAWRLVRHGLLADKGGHERVFRVIEIELAFLRDYFHARYIFFYLNGFYWKLISVVALPIMFWWFIEKSIDYGDLDWLQQNEFGNFTFTKVANTIVITVIVALEVIQTVVFLMSRWLKVTLFCYYVKTMASETSGLCSRIFLELIGFIFLGSSRSSNSARWRKPWKRELDQYSLIRSCTPVHKPTSFVILHVTSIVGIPLSKPSRKQGKKVVLLERVKEVVFLSLKSNNGFPKLSNGCQSLRKNGVMEKLPGWACELNNDIEMILVWHIATGICELHDPSSSKSSNDDMNAAINLSMYCSYLLFFSPSLLPVLALEAETIRDTVVDEALKLFNEPVFVCGKGMDTDKYDKLMALISDEEDIGGKCSVLKKGVMLGKRLVSVVEDKNDRWKILAEFWAELILYLAPSNNNEMDHAGKLSQGGEFITQLWALLIHAGITNRDDMATTFKNDDDDA